MKCRIWVEQYAGSESTDYQWWDRTLEVSIYVKGCRLV